ncbi:MULTISPECIES: hypothetical protein [Duncaniella]|nr:MULTISPECIES: hypothetical protein [Duncaniella]NBH91400.1 hypothetical protein [Muribaculaceae bacterium S4]NBI19723.1 hypothetical protein [Muribaculaceae bacterium Z1]QCD38209.1 hypothetical protein E7745_00865 [Duncaniella sp. C9]QCP71896.1 hypothetical protein FDZ78_04585 [Duncaniella sp. B8]
MNFKIFKWPIFAMAISASLTASASDCVVLWFKNGSSIVIPFSDNPQITFDSNNQINVNNRIFNFSEISKYTIGDTSSIGLIGTDGKEISVDENGDIIICSPIKTEEISVYGTDGIRYECEVITLGNGNLKISLSSLSPQIYIIKAGNRTFKMRKP